MLVGSEVRILLRLFFNFFLTCILVYFLVSKKCVCYYQIISNAKINESFTVVVPLDSPVLSYILPSPPFKSPVLIHIVLYLRVYNIAIKDYHSGSETKTKVGQKIDSFGTNIFKGRIGSHSDYKCTLCITSI